MVRHSLYKLFSQDPSTFSISETRASYSKIIKRIHPDKCSLEGANSATATVNYAFSVLSDPVKRDRYSRTGHVSSQEVFSEGDVDSAIAFVALVMSTSDPPVLLQAAGPLAIRTPITPHASILPDPDDDVQSRPVFSPSASDSGATMGTSGSPITLDSEDFDSDPVWRSVQPEDSWSSSDISFDWLDGPPTYEEAPHCSHPVEFVDTAEPPARETPSLVAEPVSDLPSYEETVVPAPMMTREVPRSNVPSDGPSTSTPHNRNSEATPVNGSRVTLNRRRDSGNSTFREVVREILDHTYRRNRLLFKVVWGPSGVTLWEGVDCLLEERVGLARYLNHLWSVRSRRYPWLMRQYPFLAQVL